MTDFAGYSGMKHRFLSFFGLKVSGTVSAARQRLGMGGVLERDGPVGDPDTKTMEFGEKGGVDAGEHGFVPASGRRKMRLLGVAVLGAFVLVGYGVEKHLKSRHRYDAGPIQVAKVQASSPTGRDASAAMGEMAKTNVAVKEGQEKMAMKENQNPPMASRPVHGPVLSAAASSEDVVSAERGDGVKSRGRARTVSDVLTSSMPAQTDLGLIGLD